MADKQMKRGDVVMVYHDPITQKKEEGKAKLLKLEIEDPWQPYWKVKFLSDGYVGTRFISIID